MSACMPSLLLPCQFSVSWGLQYQYDFNLLCCSSHSVSSPVVLSHTPPAPPVPDPACSDWYNAFYSQLVTMTVTTMVQAMARSPCHYQVQAGYPQSCTGHGTGSRALLKSMCPSIVKTSIAEWQNQGAYYRLLIHEEISARLARYVCKILMMSKIPPLSTYCLLIHRSSSQRCQRWEK